MAEEGEKANAKGEGRAKATAAGKEAGEEGDDAKEEREDDEDPGEARQQEELVVGAIVGAGEAFGDLRFGGVAGPGGAKGKSGMRTAAVLVVVTANEKVGPLANISCAVNAGCVGAQEISLVERRCVGDTRKDDEEEEQQGHCHEDQAR